MYSYYSVNDNGTCFKNNLKILNQDSSNHYVQQTTLGIHSKPCVKYIDLELRSVENISTALGELIANSLKGTSKRVEYNPTLTFHLPQVSRGKSFIVAAERARL